MKTLPENFVLCFPARVDLRPWEDEIYTSLLATGELPEEWADLFTARRYDAPNGEVRVILEWA